MRRAELEHVIRAAAAASGESEIVIVGSQAILGQHPDAPPSLLVSREADVYPRRNPAAAIEIDAAMGDGSLFDETYGYYAHGVGPETAKAPAGWEERLIPIENENTGGAVGLCLEVHDLVLAKCVAGRERDIEFAAEVLRHRLARPQELRARLPDLPLDPDRIGQVAAMLDGLIARTESRLP